MGGYQQVRSSSPTNGRRNSDEDFELREQQQQQQKAKEKSHVLVDEQKEHLLSSSDDEEGVDEEIQLDELYEPTKPRRRNWWRIGLFSLAGLAAAALLASILHNLYLKEAEKKISRTFRRPSSDYIIPAKWDYNATTMTREYEWVITDITANPDGVFRPMMVINGQFPGPMILCNEGDKIVVNVVNQAKNATSIHWHGLFQNGTNWNDGTVGITQCPIASGESFRYEFTVKGQAGSYFYHSHQGAQGLDGLFGPLIILSKEEKKGQPIPYDTDRVIMVQDWYHDASDGLLRKTLSPGSESSPAPNGALINGANKIDCANHPQRHCDSSTALLPTFDLEPNQRHRLRILNVGGFAWFEVSVDKHLHLPVTEVDGVTIEPATDSTVLIGPGQRYSVILETNQTDAEASPHLYWFRARMINHCFAENVLPDKGVPAAQAVIRYGSPPPPPPPPPQPSTLSEGAKSRIAAQPPTVDYPKTEADSGKFTVVCKDPAPGTYQPLPPRPAPEVADHSFHVRVNLEIGNWRLERGFLNASTLRPQLSSPSLHRVVDGLREGNASFSEVEGVNTVAFDETHELTVSTRKIEVVDVILQNFDEGNHPFHLHGAQMFILAAGHGYFPGYETLGLLPGGKGVNTSSTIGTELIANPTRRDVTTVEGFGWTLIRFVADNPGVWLFHCHMIWHAEAGMGMQFVSRTDVMRNWTVPEQNTRTCQAPIGELERGSAPKDSIWFGHFESEYDDLQ